MNVKGSYRDLWEMLPVQKVLDGCVISKRGDVTVGWELTLPSMYSLEERGYDDIVTAFASAVKILPEWTVVHRQDVFCYERFEPENEPGEFIMRRWNRRHFAGRRYLTHHQYLFLTLASKGSALRSNDQTAAFGIRFSADLPTRDVLRQFANKADEFISVVTSNGLISARRLTDVEFEGEGNTPGLIEKSLQLHENGPLRSDLVIAPDRVDIFGKEMMGFRLSESKDLALEVSNVSRVEKFGSHVNLFLSAGSPVGVLLDCEHTVNQYIVIPSQQAVMQELDSKKKRMVAMSNSADNRLNSQQIQTFEDEVYAESKLACYFHMNVMVWGEKDDMLSLRGQVSSALSAMGCMAVQAKRDLPSLLFASVPGGATEVGKNNLMLQELESMLCLGLNDTYEKSLEGGSFMLTDRFRFVPLNTDLQLLARKKGMVDNFNIFLLGPSGSGKSFFTNEMLSQGYANGEDITVIDIGDSYEGTCQVINEVSGGQDGMYLTWSPEHPFSFNPFVDIRSWVVDGKLVQDEGGVPFFLSFLQTAWQPAGGWRGEMVPLLTKFVFDFTLEYLRSGRSELPIFDDFYKYLGEKVAPRIVPILDEQGNVKALPADPLIFGFGPVTPEQFDIVAFTRALLPYSMEGAYSFLLNDRNPKDLFSSRFTVFEVLKLSQGDKLFYSLCILCIMNAFDLKMHRTGGFKRLCVDEAWQAIANETMAPYLKGLWKTARKYQTSAMVISQELDDVISSPVIKDAILNNSDIRILLDQTKNAMRFDKLSTLMGLSEHQKNIILSMGKQNHNPNFEYRDVYIGFLNSYGVYATEVSLEEVLSFESDKVKKAPIMERARQTGSLVGAIEEWADGIRKGRIVWK